MLLSMVVDSYRLVLFCLWSCLYLLSLHLQAATQFFFQEPSRNYLSLCGQVRLIPSPTPAESI